MLFSDLKGRKLVSTASAETVGKVDGFLLDPATRAVVALSFKKTDDGDTVPWADLTAVGTDAVTVADADLIVEVTGDLEALAAKRGAVLKKRVLDDAGTELGPVRDIDFNPQTGELLQLLVGEKKDVRPVAGTRLLGIGSYAVVVKAE